MSTKGISSITAVMGN